MKRILTLVALSCVAIFGAVQSASAGPTPSPGCKGINNALGQADRSTQGKAALAAVSEKLGCATTPPPVDDMACPTGQAILSDWYWDESREPSGATVKFVPTSTGTSPAPVYASGGDLNGVFYPGTGGFYSDPAGAATTIVIKSSTNEVVYLPGSTDPVSQNWFANRTDILYVRYCG